MALTVVLTVGFTCVFPNKYRDLTARAAEAYGIEEPLILAVIWTESKFAPNAVSRAGACGLMQLMPDTAEWLAAVRGMPYTREMLFEPSYNIDMGAYYLAYLCERFESREWAVSAYNAGEGTVRRWQTEGHTQPQYPETATYVQRVQFAYSVYQAR